MNNDIRQAFDIVDTDVKKGPRREVLRSLLSEIQKHRSDWLPPRDPGQDEGVEETKLRLHVTAAFLTLLANPALARFLIPPELRRKLGRQIVDDDRMSDRELSEDEARARLQISVGPHPGKDLMVAAAEIIDECYQELARVRDFSSQLATIGYRLNLPTRER